MPRKLPPIAILLGLAGLIPFVACALAAVSRPDDEAARWLGALVAYGAVILAFLGGVHWGLVLRLPVEAAPLPRSRGESAQLALGVAPSLIGWLALLLVLLVLPQVALGVLIAGFIGTAIAEDQLRRKNLVPLSYMALRLGLTMAVSVVLITVFTLMAIGAKIIF